jgi:hypothetical protein
VHSLPEQVEREKRSDGLPEQARRYKELVRASNITGEQKLQESLRGHIEPQGAKQVPAEDSKYSMLLDVQAPRMVKEGFRVWAPSFYRKLHARIRRELSPILKGDKRGKMEDLLAKDHRESEAMERYDRQEKQDGEEGMLRGYIVVAEALQQVLTLYGAIGAINDRPAVLSQVGDNAWDRMEALRWGGDTVLGKAMALMEDISAEGFALLIADFTKKEESMQQARIQGEAQGQAQGHALRSSIFFQERAPTGTYSAAGMRAGPSGSKGPGERVPGGKGAGGNSGATCEGYSKSGEPLYEASRFRKKARWYTPPGPDAPKRYTCNCDIWYANTYCGNSNACKRLDCRFDHEAYFPKAAIGK